MESLGDRIVAAARRYLDVRYYHAGRSEHGLDCAGLLVVVAHDVGITDYDDVDYARDPPAERLTATLSQFARTIWRRSEEPDLPIGRFEPGDLLQFEILGIPRHAGIAAADERGRATMIHAYQGANRVTEHLFDKHWQKRLWAVYRIEEGLPSPR